MQAASGAGARAEASRNRLVMGCAALIHAGSWVKVSPHPQWRKNRLARCHGSLPARAPLTQLSCLIRIDSSQALPTLRRCVAKLSQLRRRNNQASMRKAATTDGQPPRDGDQTPADETDLYAGPDVDED